ncbi:MAG: hypothetical protein RL662_150 [Bacteroidota bacterium]
MCYAGQWKEIIELGNTLVNDPESTPTMLLIWIVNGKFTAYHGNLTEDYTKLLYAIDARLEKELGRERTNKLTKFWIDEINEVNSKKSLEN